MLGLLLAVAGGLSGPARAARPAPKYPVSAIPAELLPHAASVVRAYELLVTMEKPAAYSYHVHRVVTVLSSQANDEAQAVVMYSPLQKVSALEARVYDAFGQLTQEVDASDWRNVSATDAGTFADDSRARLIDLRQPTCPYTVEVSYTITSQNPLFLPRWQPQQDWAQSVEAASLTVRHAVTLPVRRYARHLPAATHLDSTGGALVERRWSLTALPPLADEVLGPRLSELAPAIWLAPTAFEVQGHAGSQATWPELGRWNYQLNADRDALPDAVRAQMVALRTAEPDPYRRARRVYEYLQRSTRYVSIQLGLGGWQTLPASEVARTGYGDCKALTNYARALLGAAGLPAWCALVGAGDNAADLHPEWVAPQFNHVILCLPLRPDTVWLECTSQTTAFGYLGAFTANRHALLLTPDGGKLVRTPVYDAAANLRSRRLVLTLDPQGGAVAAATTRRTGLLFDEYEGVEKLPPDQQRRYVTNQLNLTGTFTLGRLRFSRAADSATRTCQPRLTEDLSLTLPTAAARSGTRLLLAPNLLAQWSALPPASERAADLWLPLAATYVDTVVVRLPPNARAESVPPPVDLATPFGVYHAHTQAAADGTLTYVRRLQTSQGHFAASQFAAYADFRRRLAKADRAQVVVVVP